MSSKYFVNYNANPFGRRIGDCSIRAVSKGLNIPYEKVCKKLGVKFVKGKGMGSDDGIDLYYLQEVFDEYFDNVENFDSESQDVPEEFKDFNDPFFEPGEFDSDMSQNISVNDFIELYKGKYLVGCMNKNGITEGHIVFVDADNKKFYDTWDCGKKKVNSYMKIKEPNINTHNHKITVNETLKVIQDFILNNIN